MKASWKLISLIAVSFILIVGIVAIMSTKAPTMLVAAQELRVSTQTIAYMEDNQCIKIPPVQPVMILVSNQIFETEEPIAVLRTAPEDNQRNKEPYLLVCFGAIPRPHLII